MMKVVLSIVVAALLLVGVAAPISAGYEAAVTSPQAEAAPAAAAASEEAAAIPAAETAVTLLTAEEAKAIALAHSGFTADQVQGLRAEYDVDDGVKEYEVEFRAGDWEYDYTIGAEDGKILKWNKEYDPVVTNVPETEPVETEPIPTESAATLLTAEEAKAIALAHAGFTAAEVQGLRAEYDVDDGVKMYEVEFRVDGWEYEFEIHAETGKILSWDKEYDD